MESIPEYTHKINERLELVRSTPKAGLRVRIRRLRDGFYFSPALNNFVDVADPEATYDLEDFWYLFDVFFGDPILKTRTIITLPSIVQDLVFEYQSFDYETVPNPDYPASSTEEFIDIPDVSTFEYFFERHLFGGAPTTVEPSLCKVFGTLKDVSGKPLSGQKIEAYLNRAGFFTHKAGLIGYASTTVTDDSGYFELPLVVGLDVTINVPIVGFTTRGFVPNLPSVELTTQTLLSYQPG